MSARIGVRQCIFLIPAHFPALPERGPGIRTPSRSPAHRCSAARPTSPSPLLTPSAADAFAQADQGQDLPLPDQFRRPGEPGLARSAAAMSCRSLRRMRRAAAAAWAPARAPEVGLVAPAFASPGGRGSAGPTLAARMLCRARLRDRTSTFILLHFPVRNVLRATNDVRSPCTVLVPQRRGTVAG